MKGRGSPFACQSQLRKPAHRIGKPPTPTGDHWSNTLSPGFAHHADRRLRRRFVAAPSWNLPRPRPPAPRLVTRCGHWLDGPPSPPASGVAGCYRVGPETAAVLLIAAGVSTARHHSPPCAEPARSRHLPASRTSPAQSIAAVLHAAEDFTVWATKRWPLPVGVGNAQSLWGSRSRALRVLHQRSARDRQVDRLCAGRRAPPAVQAPLVPQRSRIAGLHSGVTGASTGSA